MALLCVTGLYYHEIQQYFSHKVGEFILQIYAAVKCWIIVRVLLIRKKDIKRTFLAFPQIYLKYYVI